MNKVEGIAIAPRLPYVAPALSVLGTLSAMTASGSGATVENRHGMNGSCIANAQARPCR